MRVDVFVKRVVKHKIVGSTPHASKWVQHVAIILANGLDVSAGESMARRGLSSERQTAGGWPYAGLALTESSEMLFRRAGIDPAPDFCPSRIDVAEMPMDPGSPLRSVRDDVRFRQT